jgi:retinol-binding protein 3
MHSRKGLGTVAVCVLLLGATAAPEALAGQPAGNVDLPGHLARLGPDATLWYQHVQTLASPAFEGRAPGTRGMEWAAEYIEHYYRAYGLQPAFPGPGASPAGAAPRSYRQPLTVDGALLGGGVASAGARIEAQKVTSVNVAGLLAGKGHLKDQYLVIGGHYDHLGAVQGGADPDGNSAMLLGADDNASGTAAVLILARRLAAAYRESPDDTDLRSILFVAFTAEECGRLGSRQFVQSPPVPIRNIQAMLNLDMVGRLREDRVSLSGFGTATQFPDLLGGLLTDCGLHVTTTPGSGGSDQMSFLEAGIPALYAMTGGHDALHQPTDLASTMNPEGATRVIDLAERIAVRLAGHPGALTFAPQPDIGGAVCSMPRPSAAGAGGTPSPRDEQLTLPDTPAGRCVAAFLEVFNSGNDEQVRAFEQRYRAASALATRSIQDRVDQLNQIRGDLGNLTLLLVADAGETDIAIQASASKTGEEWTLAFQFEDRPPNGLLTLAITPASMPDPTGKYSTPIDEALRKDTVRQIAAALREVYVYPETGGRMADTLEKNEADGRYRALTRPGDLARRWTTDLLAVCRDHHLSIVPSAGPFHPSSCGLGAAGGEAGGSYGFQKPEILPGRIGYIKFDMFDGSEEAKEAAAAALASVAGCDALIFDLRENIGGSPKMIQFISSYLFDKPTHLCSYFDRLGQETGETWTSGTVPGKRFPSGLPVYLLTSSSTASAAEEFAYDLKSLGRATIVGTATAGGAHLVTDRTINDRFLVHLPYLRAYNPITQGNWEEVGVEPDIAVPASKALDAAREDAARKSAARR